MTWWSKIVGQLGLQGQPSQRQVLEAHIEALFERYAPQTAMTGSLVVRPTGGQYRVVVEAGLSRVEVEARTTRLAAIIVPLDAFLMHSPLGANVEVEQRLREQQLERRPGSGALEVLVIRQYRHPIGAEDWELPAGLIDVEGEEPVLTAQRELAEEADLRASAWEELVSLTSSPGGLDEVITIFLATGLSDVPKEQRHERERLSR